MRRRHPRTSRVTEYRRLRLICIGTPVSTGAFPAAGTFIGGSLRREARSWNSVSRARSLRTFRTSLSKLHCRDWEFSTLTTMISSWRHSRMDALSACLPTGHRPFRGSSSTIPIGATRGPRYAPSSTVFSTATTLRLARLSAADGSASLLGSALVRMARLVDRARVLTALIDESKCSLLPGGGAWTVVESRLGGEQNSGRNTPRAREIGERR